METQRLWPEGRMPLSLDNGKDAVPTLTIYKPAKPNGNAVVVCPGGGYGGHAPHEGEPIAKWLNTIGLTALVVTYRLGTQGYRHPAPLLDAQEAIRQARAMGLRKVGILGFSAGGHLASTAATHFAPDCRPDVAVLVYPVIDMNGPYTHVGSRNNLLGDKQTIALKLNLSNHLMVTKDTPPTFLMHTYDDTVVPVENSLLFAQACAAHKVPFALQVYEKGAHGVGLGSAAAPETFEWPKACAEWFKARGMV
jgi:acetyl esterase/lipase